MEFLNILCKYTNDLYGNTTNLNDIFEAKYGLRKNKKEGATAKSLLSKYFYYHTLACKNNKTGFCFPIFDSLARKILVKINNMPFFNSDIAMQESEWNGGNISMKEFITKLKEIKDKLGVKSYDEFDAYLWRIGKLCQQPPSYNFDLDNGDFKNIDIIKDSEGNENILIIKSSNGGFNNLNAQKHYKEWLGHINKYYL